MTIFTITWIHFLDFPHGLQSASYAMQSTILTPVKPSGHTAHFTQLFSDDATLLATFPFLKHCGYLLGALFQIFYHLLWDIESIKVSAYLKPVARSSLSSCLLR